jgi:hypothetical protein
VHIIFKWNKNLVLKILETRKSKDWERDDRTREFRETKGKAYL